MTKQQDIAQGQLRTTFKLEFRTWTGSAYTWTDYTDRISGFGDMSFQIERQAIPNAFSSNINSIRMKLRKLEEGTNFFADIATLDGVLANSAEPYGKSFYKRIMRLSSIDYDPAGAATTTVIATGRVIDVQFAKHGLEAVIKIAGLDVASKDQNCDGALAQRHSLGSDDSTTPSSWTASAPAATGEVAMYRFRELDDQQSYSFGWFRNKRVYDVLQRMSWALDDLDTDIEDITVYTEDDREIATSRNTPPDDSTVFDPSDLAGTGDMRTRASCWNTSRQCMVFAVGHKIYDYNIITNVYTLRATLTTAYQIVFMEYLNKADTNGLATRLVVVALDTSVITTPSYGTGGPDTGAEILNAPAYISVFDASGAGSYTIAPSGPNGVALGADFFPCTHMTSEGSGWNPTDDARAIGNVNNPDLLFPVGVSIGAGENPWLPFEQTVYQVNGAAVTIPYVHSQNPVNADPCDSLTTVQAEATSDAINASDGETLGTGFMNFVSPGDPDPGPMYGRWTLGQKVQCAIHRAPGGGKLYFFTWDSTDDFRLRSYDLYSYALGSYIAAPSFGTFPLPLAIGTSKTNDGDIDIHVSWLRISADPDPWEAGYYIYNTSTPAWGSQIDYTSYTGLYSNDQSFWQIMDFAVLELAPSKVIAILYNRSSQNYRVVKDMEACTSWTNTDANTLTFNGKKNQPNMLRELHVNENYTPDRCFWIEMTEEGALLWSWDGTTLRAENKTPADSDTVVSGDPISSDKNVACVAHTPIEYPSAQTPNGTMFFVTANDFEHGNQHPYGFYGLVQYANFHSGFVPLLDLGGMSFFAARSALAEKMGAVHYYAPDGTFKFKERNAYPGAAVFTFSAANKNYAAAEIISQGWEEVRSEVKMLPYGIVIEPVLGDILKGESESEGTMDVSVGRDPFERAEWQVIFTSTTAYDVYKLSGSGSSATAKASSDISSVLRDIPDGPYLSFSPDNFSGTFYKGDSFRFWVFPADTSLQQLDDRDMVFISDATTEAAYQRRRAEISSRFLSQLEAPDFAQAFLDWIKTPHPIIRLKALYDPAYLPLVVCDFIDAEFGFTSSDNFRIIAVRHGSDRMHSYVDLQKI